MVFNFRVDWSSGRTPRRRAEVRPRGARKTQGNADLARERRPLGSRERRPLGGAKPLNFCFRRWLWSHLRPFAPRFAPLSRFWNRLPLPKTKPEIKSVVVGSGRGMTRASATQVPLQPSPHEPERLPKFSDWWGYWWRLPRAWSRIAEG